MSDPAGRMGPVTATALAVAPPGRIPPQNLDAERSLLGGILLDSNAFSDVSELVKS